MAVLPQARGSAASGGKDHEDQSRGSSPCAAGELEALPADPGAAGTTAAYSTPVIQPRRRRQAGDRHLYRIPAVTAGFFAPPVPIYGEQAKKGPENPIYVVSAQKRRHAGPAAHDRPFYHNKALPAGSSRCEGGRRRRASFAVPRQRPVPLPGRLLRARQV